MLFIWLALLNLVVAVTLFLASIFDWLPYQPWSELIGTLVVIVACVANVLVQRWWLNRRWTRLTSEGK